MKVPITAADQDALFTGLTLGPKEPYPRWGQGQMNPFATVRGDKTAMQPFVKILRPLVHIISFATVRGDKTAMQPFVKILRPLVHIICICDVFAVEM